MGARKTVSRADLLPYPDALRRLLSVTSSPRMGLERMERLLSLCGDPHRQLRALHVAGTNGKGSTLAFCSALLDEAGLRWGRTTSPHLTCARERIVVDGALVDEPTFCRVEADVASAALQMLDDPPTFFERMTALAFCVFAEAHLDVVLVEVGLGGRLDASNVLRPVACGIGRIAKDHTRWLGDTVEAIAGEKAGILKADTPAFVVDQSDVVLDVIRTRAADVGTAVEVVSPVDVDVKLGLPGAHQRSNAALALALVSAAGISLDDARQRRALAHAAWPGRLESLGDGRITLDGAHNEDAAAALASSFVPPSTPWTLIMGATDGHDAGAFAQRLVDGGLAPGHVVVTQASAPRSTSADVIVKDVRRAFPDATTASLDDVRTLLTSSTPVLVTGSLYLVGEVRSWLTDMPVDPVLPLF